MKKLIMLILCLLPFTLTACDKLKQKSDEVFNSKRAELVQKAKIGAAKASLGYLRSGITIYYGNHEGAYPTDLKQLLPDSVSYIPTNKIGTLGETDKIIYTNDCADMCAPVTNEGGWIYCTNSKDRSFGTVTINSNRKDDHGVQLCMH